MVSPAAVLIAVFGLVPVVWAFVLSFQRNDLQTPATWVGLHNYRQLAARPGLPRLAVQHTVVYTLLFVPITLVLSLLAAAALNRRLRGMTSIASRSSSRWSRPPSRPVSSSPG